MPKVAIIQRPPVLLNRVASIDRAVQSIAEASAEGATLIVLPETYLPGYPSWIWRLAPGTDGKLVGQLHALLLDNAVDLGSDDLDPLRQAAHAHAVTVVCG
jgi:nitrilase